MIDKSIKKINFELRNNQLFPLKTNNDVLVSELINDYNLLYSKIYKSKGSFKLEIKNELDSLHKKYQKKYQSTNKLLHIQLNDFNYMSLLERLSPKNKAVDLFIQKVNFDVICGSFTDLGYQFVKHRINSLNYKKLNSNNYSDFYLKYIALSIYKFLKHKDNKGDQNFHESRDWLKTTEFYKKDSVYIKKQIQHLSNDLFKEKIKNLRLSSVALKESSLSKIIQKHPSPYYLIDFWATWCAPCISGIKEMKKMNFPKNVKILSLSVDKEEVKEKWQLKTKELEQNISYLIDNRIEENKEFLKFIELNSIPRYILIDKNMNLIDQSFLPPHDPQFLPKLKDVKNAKFW
ncbi:TlpA family protein disulfide reductase [Winogradskyella sp.]|uniref:TlpA family protein disulfide reductase n=1 Tax=Winogradskyella sp. TaxID=1883156 RepID=UPI003AB71CDD